MFIWKKELELGIESIDNQHKKLVEIGQEIAILLKNHEDNSIDNYDDIIEIIVKLKDYTIYHFETEEELLIKYNYPGFDLHKKEHEAFKNYISSIEFDEVDENQSKFISELLHKVINWVFNHITSVDLLYKDFIITNAIK